MSTTTLAIGSRHRLSGGLLRDLCHSLQAEQHFADLIGLSLERYDRFSLPRTNAISNFKESLYFAEGAHRDAQKSYELAWRASSTSLRDVRWN
jgi:hypothetical protein